MPYCHNCGKAHTEEDSFCAKCGAALKGVERTIERIGSNVEKRSHKGSVFLIIFLIISGYIALDVWAITQLRPVLSLESMISSITNLNVDVGYTATSLDSTIRIENPTFVPVIAGRLIYDAGYGNTKIAEGKTGPIVMGPYSTKDLPVDLEISHAGGIASGIKWIKNLFTGQKEKLNGNVYADIGITKFQIGRYE